MVKLYYGNNAYQMKTALDALAAQARTAHGEHAVERVDGEALELHQLPDLLQGATLFASERLVIIRDIGKNKPVWEALGEKLGNVSDSLQLAIVEPAPDKRTKTFKALQKTAELHECKELSEPEAAAWLVKEAERRGGEMKRADATTLVARAGTDQFRLSGELDKLLLYGDTDKAAIARLVEPTPQANVFALLDAALHKKPEALRKLLSDAKLSEDPYMLFGLLSAQVLQLAALVHADGRSSDEIARALKTHPFPLKKLAPVARQTSKSELRLLAQQMATLDGQMKSTGIDPWQLLEQTLINIAAR